MSVVYYQNDFIPQEEVLIPCDDRSFRYGDGLFETIPFYHRTPFKLSQHLHRMQEGLAALKINYKLDELPAICHKLIRQNNLANGFIRIQLSRGSGGRGYLPKNNITPHLLVETLSPATMHDSATVTVSPYQLPSEALQPYSPFKTAQKLTHTLAKIDASERGYFDAILTNERGEISEVSSGNLFWLHNNTLYTPSLTTGALAGVTRAVLMELSQLPISEVATPLSVMRQAEEIFICNSAWGVLPVAEIDDTPYPIGKETKRLQALYKNEIAKACAG